MPQPVQLSYFIYQSCRQCSRSGLSTGQNSIPGPAGHHHSWSICLLCLLGSLASGSLPLNPVLCNARGKASKVPAGIIWLAWACMGCPLPFRCCWHQERPTGASQGLFCCLESFYSKFVDGVACQVACDFTISRKWLRKLKIVKPDVKTCGWKDALRHFTLAAIWPPFAVLETGYAGNGSTFLCANKAKSCAHSEAGDGANGFWWLWGHEIRWWQHLVNQKKHGQCCCALAIFNYHSSASSFELEVSVSRVFSVILWCCLLLLLGFFF